MKIQLFSNRNSPQILPKIKKYKNLKIPPIKIASAHIHISRNNSAKFHKYPMDSLGGVADKRPLYMYMKEMVWGEISPQNEKKIPNLNS